jgi:beta-lactamase class D
VKRRQLWCALALLAVQPLWLAARSDTVRPTPHTADRTADAHVVSGASQSVPKSAAAPATPSTGSCFLLYEVGKGEVRRNPSTVCGRRVAPQSTFKIPHALAGLDAGVLSSPDALFKYDGSPQPFESWRRDHTLASALRNSVVWYFQRLATQLGPDRERDYLRRFEYGNEDPTSGLTTFWLGGSLQISPDEQLRFMRRLYADELPIGKTATTTVKRLLVQPQDKVANALGEQPFAAPWPAGAVVGAKTGNGNARDGHQVRWLVGQVARGARSWIFVSCVIGGDDTPAPAAIEQAARALRDEGVLR